MSKKPLIASACLLFCVFTTSAWAEETEYGPWGLQIASSDDGVQFGPAFESENWESMLSVDASNIDRNSSTAGTLQTGDVGFKLRAGRRASIDKQDFYTYGLSYYRPCFGQDNGVSTDGSWKLGGYVGLQRKFTGTPLMLFVWIEPYAYAYMHQNDGNGNQVTVVTNQFFQRGGFGMAYLF